jgi:beta-phosphoglucomutase-like phosphatase (HAD superfamily)
MSSFLFDLDGTLVITDEIYFKVWKTILEDYNIVLTQDIFKTYIQGNNDKYVASTLLRNMDIDHQILSDRKDALFIDNIQTIQIVQGANEFLQSIQENGYKSCIVTNCNRPVAEAIIQFIRIDDLIEFVITSEDCVNGKPNPEPYLKAMEKLGVHHTECFIFEDSKSGILSGQSTNPKRLIALQTIYTANELESYNVDDSIADFTKITVSELLEHSNKYNTAESNVDYIMNQIKESLNDPNITQIQLYDTKLKGGFIADVIQFTVQYKDRSKRSYILKYENTGDNEKNSLSQMARKLQLYSREYYFYRHIAPHINVHVPKFMAIYKNKELYDRGVILENLGGDGGRGFPVNVNLKTRPVETTLRIVDRMAKIHSKYWGRDLSALFPGLSKATDPIFRPFFVDFLREKYSQFYTKWQSIMTTAQKVKCETVMKTFDSLQVRMASGNHLTFIHGDIKSPNIFYDINNNEPFFIDWQHCAIGKGVQDLVFFVMESFDICDIQIIYNLCKSYYYKKLLEYGVLNYSWEEYETDLHDAICYIPFFTSVWFGTVPQDELIDKNFPFFFISKMVYMMTM